MKKKRLIRRVPKGSKGPKGLGGWLLFPIINFSLGILFFASDLAKITFDEHLLMVAIAFSLDALMIYLFAYTLFLIVKKRRNAPNFAIICLWTNVVINGLVAIVSDDITFIFGGIVGAVVWTAYFKISVRVKNTFVK